MTDSSEAGSYYRELVESAPDAVLVVDQDGTIELVNRQAEALFGYPRADLIGQPVEILVPKRAAAVHPSHRRSYYADPRARPMGVGLDLTARRRDSTEVAVDISLSPLRTDRGMLVSVAIREVTERKRAEVALQEANRKLSGSVRDLERHDRDMTLVNEMGDMLQSCMTSAEANQVISRYGRRLFPAGEGIVFIAVPATTTFDSVASWGGSGESVVIQRDECWALRRSRVYAVEHPGDGPSCVHLAGTAPAGYVCVPMMAQGEALGFLHVRSGSGERPEGRTFEYERMLALTVAEHLSLALANLSLRETLRHQSLSDPLTGLHNRRYMEDRLAVEIRRAGYASTSVGIVVADVDHFKNVNDQYGHGVGDEVLKAVARTIDASVRGHDTVCRFGGDEFVLILPGSLVSVAIQRAEQLLEAVRELEYRPSDSFAGVTLSMGVAAFPDHGTTADEVLGAADAAMYRAKDAGRNQVRPALAPSSV